MYVGNILFNKEHTDSVSRIEHKDWLCLISVSRYLSETDYSMTLVYLHCSDWELEVQNQGLTPTLVGLKHYFSFFSYNVIIH